MTNYCKCGHTEKDHPIDECHFKSCGCVGYIGDDEVPKWKMRLLICCKCDNTSLVQNCINKCPKCYNDKSNDFVLGPIY